MRNYREHVINTAIRDKRIFLSQTELFDFIIFEIELIGEVSFRKGSVKQMTDPNMLPFGNGFDILIVCNIRGNLVISISRDNHGFFEIRGCKREGEPSLRPLYNFPVDSPEALQFTVNGGKLLIWSCVTGCTIEMKTSDVFIPGKNWDNGYYYLTKLKINNDEVLDYCLDFIGVMIDQSSYYSLKYDISNVINTGKPVFISVRDKRDFKVVANQATTIKQMVIVTDKTGGMVTIHNISTRTESVNKLQYICMTIHNEDDIGEIFRCAMGTPGDEATRYYYNNDILTTPTEHKPPSSPYSLTEYGTEQVLKELLKKEI